MRPRTKEHLLVAIILGLLITLVIFAAALFRATGRAHFLIVPNLSPQERSKSKAVFLNQSAKYGLGAAGAQFASPLPRSGQPALNFMPWDSGMFGVTKKGRSARLGVGVRSNPHRDLRDLL